MYLEPQFLGMTEEEASNASWVIDASGAYTVAPAPAPAAPQVINDPLYGTVTLFPGGNLVVDPNGNVVMTGTLESTGQGMQGNYVAVTSPQPLIAPDGTIVPPNSTIYTPVQPIVSAPAPVQPAVTAPAPAPSQSPTQPATTAPSGPNLTIQPYGPGVTIPASTTDPDFTGLPIPGQAAPATKKSSFGMLAAIAAALAAFNQ